MRYEKQVLFKGIGEKGQVKLAKATIAVIGLGGLGSVVAEQLARAGIGKLTLIDPDAIEISNLQRQSLYGESDVGKQKSEAAKERLEKINSEIKIESYSWLLGDDNINNIKADLFIDCTDNLDARFMINDHCVKNNIPWIYGAVAGSEGFVYSITKGRPCLRCILKKIRPALTCSKAGIINSMTYTVASIQTAEALKILLKKDYCKDLIYIDLWENEYKKIKINKDPKCPVCKE